MQFPLIEVRRQAVLDLLAPMLGTRPLIVAEASAGHEWAPVTRLTFDREIPGVGRTVVVKTRRVEGDGWGGPGHLRREQAGLVTAHAAGVTPRLIASDDAVGVVITADLGQWPTLESILLGDDAHTAASAVIGLGRAVGRLHAATIHAEESHRESLESLGSHNVQNDRLGQWPGADRWHDVEVASAELGFPDASIARDDIACVLSHLSRSSPFAALVHMDVNPTNALVAPDGVKLVDFEGSTFGHIGVDASFLHYPFPNYSAHWAVIPREVVLEADRTYREELARALSADVLRGYDEMLAVGAAAALTVRVQRLRKLAEHGQAPNDRHRRRAQLVQQIRVFEQLAARGRCLDTLTDWFTRLADAMASRWEDATSPPPELFPAFRAPITRPR